MKDAPEEEGVILSVVDDGIGIPAELLPRIFEAFYTTRNTIGTGIGLFVAKQFVEGYGGTMTIESSTLSGASGTAATIFIPYITRYVNEQSSTD
ncbi:sensor histidine kinase [Granulicella cerasi]|uniref:histidine kinase n=1 Tax=Granulicella cerasi TaxID=741063 RepID=A0ABW1ZG55_9BACT|nr:ATP-binding protein [Granulicella cerasi]